MLHNANAHFGLDYDQNNLASSRLSPVTASSPLVNRIA